MTPRSPAQVSLVLDGEDQVARLERFRATHPDVPVLLLGDLSQGLGRRPEARTPDAARPARRPGGDLPPGRACLPHGDPAVTAEFDPATPNMARVYDYWLGGKDNYPADRAEAERLLGNLPAVAGSGPGEPGVRDPGCQLGRPAGYRPVHRPGRRASRLPRSPPGRTEGDAVGPGRLRRHRSRRAVPRPGAAGHQRRGDRRRCGPARPRGRAGGPGAAGRHRPGPARVPHPRRGPALPGRRRRPGGDRGIRAADGAGQLPGHLRGLL